MPLGEAPMAPREAAALIPMLEGAPQCGGNRPGPGPDFHDAPLAVVAHDHSARVAGQALRRCRGNARAPARRSTQRQLRTIRSTWAAVPARPTPSSRTSVSGVATRVSARTLA